MITVFGISESPVTFPFTQLFDPTDGHMHGKQIVKVGLEIMESPTPTGLCSKGWKEVAGGHNLLGWRSWMVQMGHYQKQFPFINLSEIRSRLALFLQKPFICVHQKWANYSNQFPRNHHVRRLYPQGLHKL
jgi:hypothetical protein